MEDTVEELLASLTGEDLRRVFSGLVTAVRKRSSGVAGRRTKQQEQSSGR